MAFEKAIVYDELPPVSGHHCCGRDGVFTRAQIDYNLVTGGSLLCKTNRTS